MRLVIRTREGIAASGLRRYRGSGIFSSIGRKLLSSGLKKVINATSKANLSQKIANVVVNGAQSVGEKLGKTAGDKIGSVVRKKVKKRFAPTPAASPSVLIEEATIVPPQRAKHPKLDIDRLINGSGIIFE